MPEKPALYKKHQSFVGMTHHAHLEDAKPRIEALAKRLESLSLPAHQKAVLKNACDEILGKAALAPGQAPFTLHSNVTEEISRITDDELPRYLIYRYRYEVYPARRILDAFPPLLQIEPTSICNFRCVFCYQTDEALTNRANGHMGHMSLDLFKKIIDQTQGQCEAVTLASRGEPLACPDIIPMLDYLQGKFLALKMNTNASLMNEAKAHAILQAGMNTLVFSADAAAEPAYSQFRVGGNLERVVKNIRLFKEIKEKHYPDSRLITRVSGVKVPGTPNLEEMEKFWGDMVDQVAFVQYNPWENVYESAVNEVAEPCSDLWRRMFVWWDGRVNPCDVDYRSTLSAGKTPDSSLSALWKSTPYQKLREHHATQKRSACSPCNRCVVI